MHRGDMIEEWRAVLKDAEIFTAPHASIWTRKSWGARRTYAVQSAVILVGIAAKTGDTGLVDRLTKVSEIFRRRRRDIDWDRFLGKLLLHVLQTIETCAQPWLRPES